MITIDNDDEGVSVFCETQYNLNDRNGMLLSQQINAVNFRLRQSYKGYKADWHVAGDPTLIIILAGVLRITLRNDDCRDFSVGAMFIAKDKLLAGQEFDTARHGHRAEVVGHASLNAIHIKLGSL
ncbi:hypothetical protein JYU13_00805 [Gammaproteobacteria bacterium AH-315-M22]|nr:hypothetical protein [Gammaproteobacteria bacterium AH-315-M22]